MDLTTLFRRQDGVLTRAQALACGLSSSAIGRLLEAGLWTLVAPRVYLSAAHRRTARARVRIGALWLGPEAVLLGAGAAWWWRLLDTAPEVLRYAVPPARRVRSRPGFRVVRRSVPARFRAVVDGVPVVSRAYAVVDAAQELGLLAGAALMDRALLLERVDLDGLRRAHRACLGRPGSAVVAHLLALAAGGARSEAERRLHGILRTAGITGWSANLRITLPRCGPAVLDVAFPASRVVVEVDGWAYHRDLPAFRRDQGRQNALALAGWTVLRLNWHDLHGDPDGVLATLASAVAPAA